MGLRKGMTNSDDIGMKDCGKLRMVYILSASHSGSTLLAMLLGSHSDVCTVGELKFTFLGDIRRYRCSCLELIEKCPFWRGVIEDMRRRGVPFRLDRSGTDFYVEAGSIARRFLRPLHRGPFLEIVRDTALCVTPGWRRSLRKVREANIRLIDCLLSRTGKKIIVDSSKVGIRLKYLLGDPRLDIRIVRLIRDGRGVALTYVDPGRFADARDPGLRGGGSGGVRESECLAVAAAAREWCRSNEEAEALLSRVSPARWLEIRYEDLCVNADATLERIFRFIGVDPKHALSDFRSAGNHVVGNGMRLDATREILLDDRWRTELTGKALKEFFSVAGDMNKRLGYE